MHTSQPESRSLASGSERVLRKAAGALLRAAPYLLALCVYGYRLDAQSLWFDELSTWWIVSRASWGSLIAGLWQPHHAYPLYHVLLKGWIDILGDSEAALRGFSVLAGVAAYAFLGASARALHLSDRLAWALLLLAPFPLWYIQEATAYGLFLCASSGMVWTLLRALERPTLPRGAATAAAMLACVSAHRLGAFLVAGCLLAIATRCVPPLGSGRARRQTWAALGVWAGLAGVAVGLIAYSIRTIGVDNALITGSHRRAGVAEALSMTFWSFGVNQNPAAVAWGWLAPFGALFVWGWLRVGAAARHDWRARTILCLAIAPTGLYCVQLWWTRVYEPRYLMMQYPIWILLLAYPSRSAQAGGAGSRRTLARRGHRTIVAAAVAVNLAMLFLADTGLWSGNPVREQQREAVAYLARRMHPDDLFMVHPGHLAIGWFYYAPRLSPDPLPHPLTFTQFQAAQTTSREIGRRIGSANVPRSLLLIAPFHARPLDPPRPDARYGAVGSFYEGPADGFHACPAAHFQGVDVLCVANPAPQPAPAVRALATFGQSLVLHGYTLKPFAGAFHAGGELPITLTWEYVRAPSEDEHVLLALRRAGTIEPRALVYGPFANGVRYPGSAPAQFLDNQAIALRDHVTNEPLPPGRYEVILSVYRAGRGPVEGRLPATDLGGAIQQHVVLTTIDIQSAQAREGGP